MFKEIIIQNAWFDFNIDYGLLHLQLATPIIVFFLLMIVLFVMNKWLFQPVFRTLDNRQRIVETSKTQTASVRVELAQLRREYEEQLQFAQMEVGEIYHIARQEAQKQKDSLLKDVRQITEDELEKNKVSLTKELEVAKTQLQHLTQHLAGMTAERLLS